MSGFGPSWGHSRTLKAEDEMGGGARSCQIQPVYLHVPAIALLVAGRQRHLTQLNPFPRLSVTNAQLPPTRKGTITLRVRKPQITPPRCEKCEKLTSQGIVRPPARYRWHRVPRSVNHPRVTDGMYPSQGMARLEPQTVT